MEKYINKGALVAEIEKIIADETESIKSFEHSKNVSEVQRSNARIGVLMHLRSLLDTLDVKDVDLEKEYDNEFFEDAVFGKLVNRNAGISIAKHFFELGLKVAQNEHKSCTTDE